MADFAPSRCSWAVGNGILRSVRHGIVSFAAPYGWTADAWREGEASLDELLAEADGKPTRNGRIHRAVRIHEYTQGSLRASRAALLNDPCDREAVDRARGCGK